MSSTPDFYLSTHRRLLCGAVCLAVLSGVAGPVYGAPGDTDLVSVSADGTRAAGSDQVDIPAVAVSVDGRYVAFYSRSTDLVPGDIGGSLKVYVRDRQTGIAELVSVGMDGASTNNDSTDVSISADGRFACFQSFASNLVPGDTNGKVDIFVYDRLTKRTERANPGLHGAQANAYSFHAKISADGRYVAFASYASNLVPGNDDTNSVDIFLTDRQTGVVERVNVSSTGVPGNAGAARPFPSGDGRYVGFESSASNLVPGDTNGFGDIFVRDRLTAQTQRISVAPGSTETDGGSFLTVISPDGRYVGFSSAATNLVTGDTNGRGDVFLWDRQTRQIERVSIASGGAQANDDSGGESEVSISADGRHVAFRSSATNLVRGDTNSTSDVFVHDRQSGLTARASVASDGAQSNGDSGSPSLSADGRYMAFVSGASNLVTNDYNGSLDVYIHGLGGAPPSTFAFTIKPSALAFGKQFLTTSTTLSVWLRNKGTTSLPIVSVGLRGTNRGMFKLANRCPASVPVGMGCSIKVTFTPTSVGAKTAKLRVVAGADTIRMQDVTGTGVEPGH